MHIEQGELLIAEYEKKFMEFSKYSLVMMAMKKDKCRRFEFGLRNEIEIPITSFVT